MWEEYEISDSSSSLHMAFNSRIYLKGEHTIYVTLVMD